MATEEIEGEYYLGNGCSVMKIEGKFFLEYVNSGMQGNVIRLEMSESEYWEARNGTIDIDEFIRTHGK